MTPQTRRLTLGLITETLGRTWRKWAHRRRYPSCAAMPMWLLIAIVGPAAIITTYLAWALSRLAPMYFETAIDANELGIAGTMLGLALIGVGIAAWNFGEIANACRSEIGKRLFQ